MSFLYPRTVSILRAPTALVAGGAPYEAADSTAETVIASGLPANIQIDRTGTKPRANLPADPIGEPTHRIFLRGTAGKGLVLTRDIIVDELGDRYQVLATEWQQIGTQIRAQLMEN